MRRILFLAALFFVIHSGSCQIRAFEIGFETGPSIASLRGNSVVDMTRSRLAFSGAFMVQYNFDKMFALKIAPGFERKGSLAPVQLTDATGAHVGDVNLFSHLDYAVLPLLFRASFGNNIKGFLNAGPYAAYLLRVSSGTDFLAGDDSFFLNQTFKSLDLGVSGGAGIIIPLADRFDFTFEVRHNFGLNNISEGFVVNGGVINTRSTGMLIGWVWRI